ncbi:hypothetical protein [Massilia luteola]|uniref:hypothetical protein n=1 Tax=Massilia luteola TaxID=3081751 RepID=UPI002ACBDADD|nr:hypothetical protein [Massilia sp. Gc5]
MPDDQTKPRRRVVGRSTTHAGSHGKTLVLSNPLDRGYLCQKMCGCNAGTTILNTLGHELKQRCTTARIWADEEINQLVWRYKAEVGFSMKTNPPKPLMSIEQPNRPSRFPLGRAMGEGLFKRDLEGRPQKGLLRIPDCIILNATGAELAAMRASGKIDWERLIPVKQNIETVLEIKFAGDKLDPLQQEAYEDIAGDDRFRLLEISDCDCGKKRPAPATAPVRVPVVTPMKRESEEVWRWYQLPQPQPSPAPPPQPQMPQYGPTAASGEHHTLAAYLKEHPGKAGVVLVGAILLLIPATRALIVGAVGATLLVTSATASAAPNQKKKETK